MIGRTIIFSPVKFFNRKTNNHHKTDIHIHTDRDRLTPRQLNLQGNLQATVRQNQIRTVFQIQIGLPNKSFHHGDLFEMVVLDCIDNDIDSRGILLIVYFSINESYAKSYMESDGRIFGHASQK